jgi:hypothetical protein
MLAAVEGHTAIVQTLIDAKADLNLPAAVRHDLCCVTLLFPLFGHVVSYIEVQFCSRVKRLCRLRPKRAALVRSRR